MERTKANLRAIRETVGLSQSDLAALARVSVTAVKQWERPDGWNPPDDVYDLIECALIEHDEAVAATIYNVERTVRELGEMPRVTLPWLRSQAQYDALGRDAGFYGVANARSRDAATRLRAMGCDVEFIAPEDRGPEALMP